MAPISREDGDPPAWGEILHQATVASRLDRVPQVVQQLADRMLQAHLVAPESHAWLSLCLDEALINAMVHGNQADPQLTVSITIAQDAARWRVLIEDRGIGFHLSDVPDCDEPASLAREHGRGLQLLRSWLDEVRYYRGGAATLLIRHRG